METESEPTADTVEEAGAEVGEMLDEDLTALLGVSAKSQEDVEDTVIQLIQDKERDNRVKQLKKNISIQVGKLKRLQKQMAACERDLAALYGAANSTGLKQRKVGALLNDQEKIRSELNSANEECRRGLQELDDCQYDFDADVEFKLVIRGFWPKTGVKPSAPTTVLESEETEQEKSIRLGEVTAFGSTLETTSEQSSSAEFQAYLRQQITELTADRPAASGERAIKRGRNEGGEEAGPSKRQKVASVKIKKMKKKKEMLRADSDEDAWHTDDSDWEGTDDEEDEKSRRRKHFDDGDKDSYTARLETWRESSQEGRRVVLFFMVCIVFISYRICQY